MTDRPQGGPFWTGVQPPLQSLVQDGDMWWDGTTLWIQKSGSWTAVTGESALPTGTTIDLGIGGLVSASHTVTAASTTLVNVPIAANTFSRIRIRAWGWVQGTATSTLQTIHVTTSVGGDLRIQIPVAAAQFIPWYFEVVLIQQAATTIQIQENSTADDANTTVFLGFYAATGQV